MQWYLSAINSRRDHVKIGKFDFCLLSLLGLGSLPLLHIFDFTYFMVNPHLLLGSSIFKGVEKMNKSSGTGSKVEGGEDSTRIATEVSKG